ncbi:endonuclease/exonuclease/phosphatase family protein [Actibacterium sp. D379-3]
MRDVIRTITGEMECPSAADRQAAAAAWGSRAAHDGFQGGWPCLNTIEYVAPAQPLAMPAALTVAAWNIERCKRVEESASVLRAAGADVVLATEMDLGMARSGQRHTTRDLAAALGMGYAFGTEFVELGAGDPFETAEFKDCPNLHGLHGNAILSRWPLENLALIPLDDGGEWFVRAPKADGQYRVGGRMAMAAQIATGAGPLTLIAAHYESESDAAGRAAQTARMLDGVAKLYGGGPCVIGGDFNTNGFQETIIRGADMLARAPDIEPAFAQFAGFGFDWRACNTGQVTTRLQPHAPPDRPLKTLDWLLTRGVRAEAPFVRPALSEAGAYLSDHEMIGLRVHP